MSCTDDKMSWLVL